MDDTIKKELIELADIEYAAFSEGLIPTEHKKILGIRLPELRRLAKRLIKKTDYTEYLNDEATDEYFEETMLRGFIIGYGTLKNKEDIDTALGLLDDFLPLIDNWSVCDSFCNTFKIASLDENREEVLNHLIFFMRFGQEYAERAAFVIFINHLLKYDSNGNKLDRYKTITPAELEHTGRESEMLDKFLSVSLKNYKGKPYSQMGASWFLAEAFNIYPDKIWRLIQTRESLGVDKRTYSLTLRKIIESRIPSEEVKNMVKKLRVTEVAEHEAE